jgi:imidazolonepropionase-like amidohydrolase
MSSVLRSFLFVFLISCSAWADSIIRDVSVVDVTTGRIEPHRDIVVRGTRIAAIRPAAVRSQDTRYAIPGLWDMHVHLWFPRPQFGMYLASGVTGVRDMGSDLKRVRSWQAEIAKGTLAGPRIYTCGAPLSNQASKDRNLPVNVVETPAQARAAFIRAYEDKVDFIEVLDLSGKSFEALAEISRHDGIPFAGRLPLGVPAAEAAQDRMVSMEHLFGIGLACSSRQMELRNRELGGESLPHEVVESYDPRIAANLWDLLRRYDVRQTPTLTLWARATGEDAAAQYAFAAKLTGEMAKAGVPVLAGTDTGAEGTTPGLELHKELALLVQAGLTPAQALRSATTEPARLMRRERELGELRAGFDADIVILTADPLADISNTRKIESVVVRGRVFDRSALTRMRQ